MKWSQIKTLFIFSFLILNIYLAFQLYEKREQADISILERQESTIEEQLKAENIKIEKLPDERTKEPFISVRQKAFTEKEMDMFNSFENQQATLISNNFIVSLFKKPVSLPKDDSPEVIEDFVRNTMIFPNDYVYWDWNKDINVLIFFQEKNERPVYFNQNGMIIVYLNNNNEIIFYTQTMLGEADSRQDKKALIKPIEAIEKLYNSNELFSGDEITKVDIGFHTRVPLANGVQVFVPTWKVSINDKKSYFVNAIEGFIFSSDELDFLEKTMTHQKDSIKESSNGEEELKEQILELLNERLLEVNRGEL